MTKGGRQFRHPQAPATMLLSHVRVTTPPPTHEPASMPMKTDDTPVPARQISIAIDRAPRDVYAFAADPANLPQWAAGLSGGKIENLGNDEWSADSPMGRVKIKFAATNVLGVLDHDVTLPNGEVVHNPMRVVPNGRGECDCSFRGPLPSARSSTKRSSASSAPGSSSGTG